MPNDVLLGNRTPVASGRSSWSAGVTLFSCLSGVLLYRRFAAPIARGNTRLPVAAYFHSIAPAYWFVLIVTGLVLATVSVREPSGHLTIGRLTPFGSPRPHCCSSNTIRERS